MSRGRGKSINRSNNGANLGFEQKLWRELAEAKNECAKLIEENSELKQKKVIRAVGCSCHGHGALKVAAEHPWVDVIYARINHKGAKMGDSPEAISRTILKARENGKAVVGIKIFGEGTLVKPEQKDASLKFVLGNELVDAMTIGMLSTEEVDDSIARINKVLKA